MILFKLKFKVLDTRQKTEVSYTYDGCGHQAGYDFIGWILRCVEFARQEGFLYCTNTCTDSKGNLLSETYPEILDVHWCSGAFGNKQLNKGE